MTRSIDEVQSRRDRFLGKGAPLFYEGPVHLVRGEGVWLYGADGRRYMDLYNNVPCVGHAHPHVVQAMSRQAATHNVHSRYLDEGIIDYAERLTDLHAPEMSVVFACSGTEANEIAMRMARIATGGQGFICTSAAYHGNSAEVGKLTHAPLRGRRGIHAIPFPERFRGPVKDLTEPEQCAFYLAEVDKAIADFATAGIPLAGMLVCPILANEGLPRIPRGFMSGAAERVRAAGGLFICDEVQAGFCRTGEWWGYQVSEVIPDVVTSGKPMGNGLPLAACTARRELVDQFRAQTRYFNTFAASPLQAAVGMAVLDVIEAEDVRGNVNRTGALLRSGCETLAQAHPCIGDVRGQGLFVGLEWVKDRISREVDREGAVRAANLLRLRGYLVSNAGAFGNVLKIRPPLVFNSEHAGLFLDALESVLREMAR
jgi:4-aminobutyrate aminotransferase-like enzyme